MKVFIYILMILAIFLVIYNLAQVDFDDPLGKDSIVAVITTIAGLCALMILAILRTSQKIRDKVRRKS
ncbi:MAG: hypothetical protein HKN00_01160 [Flavobacteriaceae bacterium]|nr:hypothetical protein [Bacteroidia bacterium]MBT8288720.1 hypothetical protein [Bacteroidia bacterium]NNF73765.1 hypothetical protein [Flavobacteriaceae bacterium]NNK72541.1 hypothetical protein [Flavobacteriaceae bacterium]